MERGLGECFWLLAVSGARAFERLLLGAVAFGLGGLCERDRLVEIVDTDVEEDVDMERVDISSPSTRRRFRPRSSAALASCSSATPFLGLQFSIATPGSDRPWSVLAEELIGRVTGELWHELRIQELLSSGRSCSVGSLLCGDSAFIAVVTLNQSVEAMTIDTTTRTSFQALLT